jgi:hypothetical protein
VAERYALLVRWPDGTLEDYPCPTHGQTLFIGPKEHPEDSPVPLIGEHGRKLGELVVRHVGPGPEWLVARYTRTAARVDIQLVSGRGSSDPRRFIPQSVDMKATGIWAPPGQDLDEDDEHTVPDAPAPAPAAAKRLIGLFDAPPETISKHDAERAHALADYVTGHECALDTLERLKGAECWSVPGRARELIDRMRNACMVMLGNADFLCETEPDQIDLTNLEQRPRGQA